MERGIFSPDDTIAAWAGAPAHSALGIVRLSGPRAHEIAGKIAGRTPDPERWCGADPQAFYTRLRRADGSGSLIDHCISLWFRAPHSYTGEDMVEFSIHGNPILGNEVVDECIRLGARLANPGEFTERAFLSGKMDLSQAEAVQELIASKSRREIEAARSLLSGGLRRQVEEWYARIVKLRASLEVIFDYPGDVSDVSYQPAPSEDGHRQYAVAPGSEEAEREAMREILAEITEAMDDLVAFHDRNKALREGVRVALAGAPNVGKSSLFNALAGYDRALTDAKPGTTRDYLELTLGWEQLTLTLVDTAGLRSGGGKVEKEGISRAYKVLADADAVLFLIDASDLKQPYGETATSALSGIPELSELKELVLVANKIDLIPNKSRKKLEAAIAEIEMATGLPVIEASAATGEGVAALRAWLAASLSPVSIEDRVLISERHRARVGKALYFLRHASESLRQGVPTDLVCIDLADAQRELAAITGREPTADLINEIFRGFCVGK
ncbi:MAG: tRNA modification GTPase [bacterium]